MRVLLAQGETVTAQEAEEMLRAAGLDCDATTSGRQAVALALRARYDLIVLDRKLQDIDGYEVLRRLHAGGVLAPVLLQSVKSGSLVGLEGALDGPGYLIEQVPAEDLGARIARLADENRETDPVEVYEAGTSEGESRDAEPWNWDFCAAEDPDPEPADVETLGAEPWFTEFPAPESPEPAIPDLESPAPESPKAESWQAEKPLETVDEGFASPPRVGLADLLGTSGRRAERDPDLGIPAFSGARKPFLEPEITADPAAESDPDGATAGHESRRRSLRVRTIKSGQIIYNNASSVMDCRILNLSDDGATLEPRDVLPSEVDRFHLKVQSDTLYECHVRWRSGQKVGVAFAA